MFDRLISYLNIQSAVLLKWLYISYIVLSVFKTSLFSFKHLLRDSRSSFNFCSSTERSGSEYKYNICWIASGASINDAEAPRPMAYFCESISMMLKLPGLWSIFVSLSINDVRAPEPMTYFCESIYQWCWRSQACGLFLWVYLSMMLRLPGLWPIFVSLSINDADAPMLIMLSNLNLQYLHFSTYILLPVFLCF